MAVRSVVALRGSAASSRRHVILAASLGAITSVMQWLVWRSLHGVPAITDEASYLLQAKLFAHFRWTAPPPPIRAFFEQAHVLVSPVIASKYPPGHALLLAFGAFFGMPGLVPVLLSGLTAGLLFAITRRLTNVRTAVLAWFLWTFAPIPEGFRPSYFSEVTTAATWMAAWWALLRWRDDPRTRWLVLVSVATAWCAITRPVTAVAFAIPTGLVTLRMIQQRRAWRAMTMALAAGMLVVAILPQWNWRTLGSVASSPYSAYNHAYLPFEHLGLGDNGGRTPTTVPYDIYMQFFGYANVHAEYTAAKLPSEALSRVEHFFSSYFGDAAWSAILAAFIPIGVFVSGLEGLVAAVAIVALFGVYLLYAHPAIWTLYYYEAVPAACFLAAAGFARTLETVGRMLHRDTFARRAIIATVVLCLPFGLATQGSKRLHKEALTAAQTYFVRGTESLPGQAIVFVHYAPQRRWQVSYIDNDPDLAHERVWKVRDLGDAEDARLRALAPERAAFLYDEVSGKFYRMP